ncbi:MAG: hypothetical protein AAB683_00010 [Patescibacteria group bacterium]
MKKTPIQILNQLDDDGATINAQGFSRGRVCGYFCAGKVYIDLGQPPRVDMTWHDYLPELKEKIEKIIGLGQFLVAGSVNEVYPEIDHINFRFLGLGFNVHVPSSNIVWLG